MKTNPALWQAINAYDIDAADAVMPFSRRLARDNGWVLDFASRAIAEYKRFIYLVCVSGHTMTPSEEVDSVWHLHLIYTRDYWERFCGGTLQRKIHHGPTEGGAVETQKYLACYRQTLDLYRVEFGIEPPNDMWPGEAVRFGRQAMRLVDTRTHLVLPKRKAVAYIAVASALALAACSPEALTKEALPVAFFFVIVCIVVAGALSSGKRSKNKGDGSGCGGGGCGSSGSDSGSGCGGGCGGGD